VCVSSIGNAKWGCLVPNVSEETRRVASGDCAYGVGFCAQAEQCELSEDGDDAFGRGEWRFGRC